MVRMTYVGLGSRDSAVAEFDALLPHVLLIRRHQEKCWPRGPDDMALEIAVDGLETAAFHFTRRRLYYDRTRVVREHGRNFYPGLGDRVEAIASFGELRPYFQALGVLQHRCKPYGRDYLALDIAKQCLDSAAYHFTRIDAFYGLKGDGAGRRAPT